MRMKLAIVCGFAAMAASAALCQAADWGLKSGNVELQTAGPLAFGPDGVLFLGDPKAAAIHAIATGDGKADKNLAYNIDDLHAQLAKTCGAAATVNDLAVNPQSGEIFLSVTAGKQPMLVRIAQNGELSKVDLSNVKCSHVMLPNAPEDKVVSNGRRSRNHRDSSITDLAFHEGKVLVSGLTNAAASSSIREIPFPFAKADGGVSLEIYHAAHGRVEDNSPVQTFVPFNINGEANLLAGFTCTPLVKFPVSELTNESAEKVRGVTVAELGNRNRPLDMIVYEKGGKRFLLMANSARGVMKVSTDNIERSAGLNEPVKGGGTAGQEYETVESLQGVTQLDRLDDHRAVVIREVEGGLQLSTVDLP